MKEIFEKYANKLGEARDQSVTWVELLQCLLDVANKNIENVNNLMNISDLIFMFRILYPTSKLILLVA